MECIATFDIGTTAVKAVLVGMDGEVLQSRSQEIPTCYEGDRREQEPQVWWEAFCALSREMREVLPEGQVQAIVMSGQMQDVIPVDAELRPVGRAILYSDGRAAREAEELVSKVGMDRILEITGNGCDGSLSLPKIMWIRKHEPERYAKTHCFLISSKDYVIARLTGKLAGDHTACATACAMEIQTRAWSGELLSAAGISPEKLPALHASHEAVGQVTEHASLETGYPAGTPIFAGVGDAGATTLASGISREGEYNVNLGTSGWVATISESPLFRENGVFNLAAMPKGKIINVVPFLNAANVHRWVAKLFSEKGNEPNYDRAGQLLERSVPGAHGVMALPYLVGERYPVLDAEAKGAYVGLTPETSPEDLARAMLEGVAFSIRQGIEEIGIPAKKVSVIGGGGRVSIWCQILADVLGTPVTVFGDSDTLPARAIAAAAMIGLGRESDYSAFITRLAADQNARVYEPIVENVQIYGALFERYCGLYPALKTWYVQG